MTLLEADEGRLVPATLVAVTVNVYAAPLVRPPTVIVVHGAMHVPVNPPGKDVAVYEMMAEPPLEAGALNVTVAWVLPAVAAPIVGAPGTANATTVMTT